MRVVVASAVWPRIAHSVNAPPVIAYEFIRALNREPGIEVALLKLTRYGAPAATSEDIEGAERLREEGISIEELSLPPHKRKRWFPRMLLSARIEDFIPEAEFREQANQIVRRMSADVVLPYCTEWGTMLLADAPGFKFAYYGNPDPKNYRIQTSERRRLGKLSYARWKLEEIAGDIFERLHLEEMGKYQINTNLSANDASYYAASGIPNSFYLQNLWLNRFDSRWREMRAATENRAGCHIIGSVGKLFATANSLGLEILGRDVLPELRRSMKGKNFHIDILGAGKLRPDVEKFLDAPEVNIRGYVPDIDEEILRSNIFLGMNNAGAFKVCHTRYLHAWTLGSCLVLHSDAALSMPEIVHRKNALLGRDAAEIADLVAEASADPALRQRLGEAGYQTYLKHFTGPVVAGRVAALLRENFVT